MNHVNHVSTVCSAPISIPHCENSLSLSISSQLWSVSDSLLEELFFNNEQVVCRQKYFYLI